MSFFRYENRKLCQKVVKIIYKINIFGRLIIPNIEHNTLQIYITHTKYLIHKNNTVQIFKSIVIIWLLMIGMVWLFYGCF